MNQEYNLETTPWEVKEDDFPANGENEEQIKFLLRYAILAPSSHNTQPWNFSVNDEEVLIYPDFNRWLSVADSDKREIYISIGCALENLLLAADHFGYRYRLVFLQEPHEDSPAVKVKLEKVDSKESGGLLDQIKARHTNHKVYDAKPIAADKLHLIQNCCEENGLMLHLTDDSGIKRTVDDLMVEGDAIQFSDPDWREELGYWLGKGVFGTSWVTSKMSQLAVTYLNMGKNTGKKDSELLMSAPVLGVISSESNNRKDQIQAGQVFEKISLIATENDIRLHPMSQILEIPELKERVSDLIPVSGVVPQHTFRLGYAEREEHTPRWPLEAVLNNTNGKTTGTG